MPQMRITATCRGGHTQSITYECRSLQEAELFAGLLDGTSPAYVHPPGPESVIGKCGICGTPIRATAEEVAGPGYCGILVNGKRFVVLAIPRLAYEAVTRIDKDTTRSGTLTPGECVTVGDGMRFECIRTGNA